MKRLQAEKTSWNKPTINGCGSSTTNWWRLWRATTFWIHKARSRAVQSAALVKALTLNMEGKTEQALREIKTAIENGEALPELGLDAGSSGISIRTV